MASLATTVTIALRRVGSVRRAPQVAVACTSRSADTGACRTVCTSRSADGRTTSPLPAVGATLPCRALSTAVTGSTGTGAEEFDPAAFAGTRRTLGVATSLPGHCYTSQAWFQRELERVFKPTWLLVGREDEFTEVGSYMTVDAPGVGPVVVVRDKHNVLRAFANVCRHRGAVLLRKERGTVRGGIVCPYHAWAYGTDGKLKGAPKTKRKPRAGSKAAGAAASDDATPAEAACFDAFDRKDYPLLEVRMETVGGFLFINGAGDSVPSLAASLGNCGDLVLRKWPLDDMVTVGRAVYEVGCNWKFLFENTSETYHTSYVHKDSLGPMPSSPIADAVGTEPIGDWDAVHVPGDRSVVPLPGEAAPFPEVASETFFTNMFPSLQLNVTHDCAWWMRMLPLAVDRTLVTQGFLFPKSTVEGMAPAEFEEHLKPYRYRWDLAVREDNEISENQQRGVSSTLYTPGPYNALEFGTHKFDKYVVGRVLGDDVFTPPPHAS